MTAVAGAPVAIRIETATAGTFVDLAGLRSKSISINNEPIDITSSDSSGRWTQLLAAIATRSVEISGDGVFRDGAPSDRLRTIAMQASPIAKFQFFVPSFGTFEGDFFVASFEVSADHSDATQFSASFQSAGDVTFTNIA